MYSHHKIIYMAVAPEAVFQSANPLCDLSDEIVRVSIVIDLRNYVQECVCAEIKGLLALFLPFRRIFFTKKWYQIVFGSAYSACDDRVYLILKSVYCCV